MGNTGESAHRNKRAKVSSMTCRENSLTALNELVLESDASRPVESTENRQSTDALVDGLHGHKLLISCKLLGGLESLASDQEQLVRDGNTPSKRSSAVAFPSPGTIPPGH